jgi:hypothetical protein
MDRKANLFAAAGGTNVGWLASSSLVECNGRCGEALRAEVFGCVMKPSDVS